MTDPHLPLSDEEISAVMDGEADADLAARVSADPVASARLAHLTMARDAVAGAAVAPLDAETVDSLVARAMASAADGDGTEATAAPLPPSRRGRRSVVPPWLVAAAVVVLAGLGLYLVWSGHDDSSDRKAAAPVAQDADTADQFSGGGQGGNESSAESPAAGLDASPTTMAFGGNPGPVALGTFSTPDELRQSIKTGLASSAKSGTEGAAPTVAATTRCEALVRTTFAVPGAVQGQAWATVGGDQVLVFEYRYKVAEEPKASTLVVAAGRDSCNVVLSFVR